MKKLVTLFLTINSFFVFAQTTLTIKPNASIGKDAYIESYNSSTNYGIYPNYAAIAWSGSGHSFVSRGLLQFDLSSIPSNAIITNASLNLYCNTTSDHPQLHSSLSGSNACNLQRITSTWDESTVTWNNQPTTSTTNQVTLAQSSSQTQDYLNIDVKDLVTDMIMNPNNSFGFMLKLQIQKKLKT